MATVVKRGLATLEGTKMTIDVILYQVPQSAKISHSFEEEIVKDNRGFDAAWLGRNEHQTVDLAMKLAGDTTAHVLAAAAFLAPYATVQISVTDAPALAGTQYQVISGSDIDLGNTKVADITWKLRKYADSTQAAASVATPT